MTSEMSEQDARALFRDEIGLDTAPEAAEPDVTEAEPVTPEPQAEPVAQDRPRNPDGTFAPMEQEPELDPDVQAFIEHHGGGDQLKALRAAAAIQKNSGAREAELARLKAIEERFETLSEPEPVDVRDDQWSEWIAENPGNAATWAVQNGQAAVYEAAMEHWYETDPRRATQFESALREQQLRQEFQQQYAPVQQNLEAQQLGIALQQTSQAYPELADPQWIEQVLLRPEAAYAAAGLRSQDPGEKASALRAIGALGRGLGIGVTPEAIAAFTPAANGATPPAPPQQADPRQHAHVAQANYSPARATPSREEQGRAWFRQQIGLTEE